MEKRERRFVEIKEIRTAGDENEQIIEGYPIVYGVEADLGFFREKIRAGAATEALNHSDEFVLFNHDSNYPLARRANGTLEVKEDKHGVHIKADLSKSAEGRNTYEMIKNGLIDKMSFAFTVEEDEWTRIREGDEDTETREIVKFKELYDYSPVTRPAYEQTQVQARSAEEVFNSRNSAAAEEQSETSDEEKNFEELLDPYYKELELIGENNESITG